MSFEGFIKDVCLLDIGETVKYWHYLVKYEHTKTIWVYYRDKEIAVAHDKNEAVTIIRAVEKALSAEFTGY